MESSREDYISPLSPSLYTFYKWQFNKTSKYVFQYNNPNKLQALLLITLLSGILPPTMNNPPINEDRSEGQSHKIVMLEATVS